MTKVLSLPFLVVQPYGRDKARESTIISGHHTAAEAFAEIDRFVLGDGAHWGPIQRDRIARGGR